jgi:hypothetical protein
MTRITEHTTPRQTYRALVAAVADKAKAKLPACNGRVEAAVALVLAHDVLCLDNGTVEVGSASDPLKVHVLTGATCDCADFPRAPASWCKHRLAHAIYTRVHQEMAARSPDVEPEIELPADFEMYPDNDAEEVEPPPTPVPQPLPEAPASVNVRVQIGGRECQVTLRGMDELEVLARLERLLARYPVPDAPAPAPQAPAVRALGWCAVHHVQMQQHTNAKGSWFSHFIDGRHCKGR